MKIIAENDEVLLFLSNKESLLSGKIEDITIKVKKNVLCIELNIHLMYSKKFKTILLEFQVIKEYSFSYSSDMFFYNIERYTFFKEGNLYYISLDPADEQEIRDSNDNDFIVAESVFLYEISE